MIKGVEEELDRRKMKQCGLTLDLIVGKRKW